MRNILFASALAMSASACGSCLGDDPQQQRQEPQQTPSVSTLTTPRQTRAPLRALTLDDAAAPAPARDAAP